jgi:radical SAM-linked protein
VTSDCEFLDLVLSARILSGEALRRLSGGLPRGIRALSVAEIGLSCPSLQSQVRWAEYEVTPTGVDTESVRARLCDIMDARSLPAEYKREKKVREYDLRPLIIGLEPAKGRSGEIIVVMRLRAEPDRTARADQVAAYLGLPDNTKIHRTRLVLEEVPAVLLNHRRLNSREDD